MLPTILGDHGAYVRTKGQDRQMPPVIESTTDEVCSEASAASALVDLSAQHRDSITIDLVRREAHDSVALAGLVASQPSIVAHRVAYETRLSTRGIR